MNDINNLFAMLAGYERIADETQALINSLKDEIKEYMENNNTDTVIGTEHKATYKSVYSERFDSKLFKACYPDMYSKYTKKVESKRFTFV